MLDPTLRLHFCQSEYHKTQITITAPHKSGPLSLSLAFYNPSLILLLNWCTMHLTEFDNALTLELLKISKEHCILYMLECSEVVLRGCQKLPMG